VRRPLSPALLLSTLLLTGCGVTPKAVVVRGEERASSVPPKAVDPRWDDEISAVSARLRLSCKEWHRWREGRPFESCSGAPDATVHAFGGTALMTLIRQGSSLEGVVLDFHDCSTQSPALAAAIRKALGTGAGDGSDPYEIRADDSLFHFRRSTCTLTLAGPRFGPAFSAALLGEGLGGLFRVR
jgi:hypothetical protein